MKVEVPKGKYVLAVSGGLDSMVLLDLLAKQPGLDLIVSHFNHGIRTDSSLDEELVVERAKQLKLAFAVGKGRLGPKASEEAARQARYEYLYSVQKEHGADALITAHHQDDLIETAFINLLRGTSYKGLIALETNPQVIRPLLGVSKAAIKRYAIKHQLSWREDSTNQEDKYLRNYLRLNVTGKLNQADRQNLLKTIENVAIINAKLESEFANLSQYAKVNDQINRYLLSRLPSEVASELIAYWLRQAKLGNFDRKTLHRLNATIRTAKPNTAHPVKGQMFLKVSQKTARFTTTV